MNELLLILLIGVIVFSTAAIEGISGFGSTILALPFVIMLIGIEKAIPLLTCLGWILGILLVCRSWRNIQWREYLFIAAHVALCIPVGLLIMDYLPRNVMTGILVCFMLFVGIKGFYTTLKNQVNANQPVKKNIFMHLILICGGIIHGAFSSGGPVIVIYASRALPHKSNFRVTLSMLWSSMNVIMLSKWTIAGNVWTPQLGRQILCAIPFVLCGLFTGDYLHHKVNERTFRLIVYSILMIAALSLGFNVLRQTGFFG